MAPRTKRQPDAPPASPRKTVTRRQLLVGSGLAVASSAFPRARADHPAHGEEKPAPPFKFGSEPARERKSFHDLTEPEARTLCNAVGYMRDGSRARPLPVDSALQWDQYVSTHAHHCSEPGHLQVHWSWLFLPWHRAYLFFLERHLANIVTTVFKQDGTRFALPYWDWENHKEVPNTRARQGKRPSPFFGYDLEVDDLSDPDPYNQGLWDGYRGPTVDRPRMDPKNEKGPVWKGHTAETVAYTSPLYVESLLGFPFHAFAGRKAAEYPAGQGLLEIGPHNYIHDWVGSRYGANRDMGNLRYAALDPLFYLHHAKIDEVWSRYRYQPDAASIEDWYKQSFNFRDVDGRPVSVTVRDTVENMKNVVYRPSPAAPGRPPVRLAKDAPKEHSVTVVDTAARLTNRPVSLARAELAAPMKGVRAKPDDASVRSLLEFEVGGISSPGRFYVRVFVNKPDATAATDVKDEHFIGTFGALGPDPAGARGKKEATAVFLVNVSRPVSNFYKVAPPGKPFTLTLVPVGTPNGLKGFGLTVKKVRLKVYE